MIEVENRPGTNTDRTRYKTYRFESIAFNISERIEPQNTDLDYYVGLEHIDPDSIHIKRNGTPSDVEGTKLKFYAGDLIFGKRRAYQRKAAIAERNGICSAHAMVLRANPKVILPELFPFFIHSDQFMNRAIDISVGSLSPTINWSTLKTQEFLLPPLEEQARLAELLWAGDEVVEKYQNLLDLNELIANSLSELAFNKNKKSVAFKEIGQFTSGSTPLRSNQEYFEKGQIPWVKTLDLNNGIINETEERITEKALKESSCKLLPMETVLVAMYGGFNQIGRTGLLKIEAATNQALCAIQINQNVAIPKFILYQLNAKRDYWKKVAVSSRKDPNITKSDVENFPVYLPSKEIQSQLVEKMDAITEVRIHLIATSRDQLKVQRELINQIFRS